MSRFEPSYRWMETLLDLLNADYDRPTAMSMLRDVTVRAQAITVIEGQLEGSGMAPGFLQTDAGENLFVAVLSLRIKFPIEEAREKVRLNIAMREGRS